MNLQLLLPLLLLLLLRVSTAPRRLPKPCLGTAACEAEHLTQVLHYLRSVQILEAEDLDRAILVRNRRVDLTQDFLDQRDVRQRSGNEKAARPRVGHDLDARGRRRGRAPLLTLRLILLALLLALLVPVLLLLLRLAWLAHRPRRRRRDVEDARQHLGRAVHVRVLERKLAVNSRRLLAGETLDVLLDRLALPFRRVDDHLARDGVDVVPDLLRLARLGFGRVRRGRRAAEARYARGRNGRFACGLGLNRRRRGVRRGVLIVRRRLVIRRRFRRRLRFRLRDTRRENALHHARRHARHHAWNMEADGVHVVIRRIGVRLRRRADFGLALMHIDDVHQPARAADIHLFHRIAERALVLLKHPHDVLSRNLVRIKDDAVAVRNSIRHIVHCDDFSHEVSLGGLAAAHQQGAFVRTFVEPNGALALGVNNVLNVPGNIKSGLVLELVDEERRLRLGRRLRRVDRRRVALDLDQQFVDLRHLLRHCTDQQRVLPRVRIYLHVARDGRAARRLLPPASTALLPRRCRRGAAADRQHRAKLLLYLFRVAHIYLAENGLVLADHVDLLDPLDRLGDLLLRALDDDPLAVGHQLDLARAGGRGHGPRGAALAAGNHLGDASAAHQVLNRRHDLIGRPVVARDDDPRRLRRLFHLCDEFLNPLQFILRGANEERIRHRLGDDADCRFVRRRGRRAANHTLRATAASLLRLLGFADRNGAR